MRESAQSQDNDNPIITILKLQQGKQKGEVCERESENGLLQQLLDDENATSDHLAGLTVDQIMNFWKYIMDEQQSVLDNIKLQFLLYCIQETILRGAVVEYFRSAQKLGLTEDLLQLFKDENLIIALPGETGADCLDSQGTLLLVKPHFQERTKNKPTQYKRQEDESSEQSGPDLSKHERLLRDLREEVYRKRQEPAIESGDESSEQSGSYSSKDAQLSIDMLSKVYHEVQEGAIELYKTYCLEKEQDQPQSTLQPDPNAAQQTGVVNLNFP